MATGPSTKFIIEEKPSQLRNVSSGVIFKGKNIVVARRQTKRFFPYYKFSNLSRTNHVEIFNSKLEQIDMPEKKLKKLAQFLCEDSEDRETGFDCFSFAHQLNDLPYKFGHFKPAKWSIKPLKSESALKVGDTIFISKKNDAKDSISVTHFAIYIGDALYISKFGSTGKLIVTTLEEMQNGFGGRYVFEATPKKRR